MNNDAVNKFLERVRSAQRSRSKEVRLTIEEANEIATNIAQLLGQSTKLLNDIVELQKNQGSPTNVAMDGGGFK